MKSKYKSSFQRLIKIDEVIRNEKFPSTQRMAKILGVSTRTIQRDILYMESELSAPIMYNKKERGYYYLWPNFTLTDINFTEEDVSVLSMAQSLLESFFAGSFFKSTISKKFDELYSRAANMQFLTKNKYRNIIQFAMPESKAFPFIEKLLPHIQKEECFAVINKKDESELLIKPIRLIYAWNFWFLLCHKNNFTNPKDFLLLNLEHFLYKRICTKTENLKFPNVYNFYDMDFVTYGKDIGYTTIKTDSKGSEFLEIKIDAGQTYFILQYKLNNQNETEFIENDLTTKTGMEYKEIMNEL